MRDPRQSPTLELALQRRVPLPQPGLVCCLGFFRLVLVLRRGYNNAQ